MIRLILNVLLIVWPRGCGAKKLAQILELAKQCDGNIMEALRNADQSGITGAKALVGIANFVTAIETLMAIADLRADQFIQAMLGETGYLAKIEADRQKYSDKGDIGKADRMERYLDYFDQLVEMASHYPNILDFLDGTVADDSDPDDESDRGMLISTIHRSKGLEFTAVFIPNVPDRIKGNDPEERRRSVLRRRNPMQRTVALNKLN